MPKVGDKHFSYSAKGKKAAKAYAEKTGQSVKKYYGGGSVDPFSTKNPEGVPAQQVAEAMEKQNMAIPTTNAMDRSQTSPDVTEYKEGGAVSPVGNPDYKAKPGQKSTLMRNAPKKEYELQGLFAVEKKKSRSKKKKSKSNNIAAIDKPKVRKELKKVDPRGKSSKKAKKYFEDDSSGRA